MASMYELEKSVTELVNQVNQICALLGIPVTNETDTNTPDA